MKHDWTGVAYVTGALILGCVTANPTVVAQNAPRIVHDSEYYILETQHGERCAKQHCF